MNWPPQWKVLWLGVLVSLPGLASAACGLPDGLNEKKQFAFAEKMIEDGLFEKFPVDSVYGMHNMPGIPAGEFAIRPGPIMASFDIFEITLTGTGTHAALPQLGRDPTASLRLRRSSLTTLSQDHTQSTLRWDGGTEATFRGMCGSNSDEYVGGATRN